MHNPYQSQIEELEKQIQANQKLAADSELAELAHQEIVKLSQQKKVLEEAADQLQEYDDTADGGTNAAVQHRHAILEFRQGAGGDEAKIWAEELKRMYLRFAEKIGLKVEFIDDDILKIKGSAQLDDQQLTAYQILQFESGVHRVQRVPVTESQGRIHTSTATVAVLPEVHPQAVQVSDDDLEWQFMRSSGAGGQSVNKTNSAVRLTHLPTGIVVTARQERKQAQNRQIALELLRSQLWEIQEEERLVKLGKARPAIGRARRFEKIRTYNFPQNRVTDHRFKKSWYDLENILNGDLEEMIATTYSALVEEPVAETATPADSQ